MLRDVTERKELEERLRKSDTLHVVGELAAGIAHEIRNPMTALKGFIQLLKGSIKEDHTLYFNVITSELKRIESIITEFLILAKPQAIMYEEKMSLKSCRIQWIFCMHKPTWTMCRCTSAAAARFR